MRLGRHTTGIIIVKQRELQDAWLPESLRTLNVTRQVNSTLSPDGAGLMESQHTATATL